MKLLRMCRQGKPSCECAGNSPHLIGSEPGNPGRADPEGVQALSVLTKPFLLPEARENICLRLISEGLL